MATLNNFILRGNVCQDFEQKTDKMGIVSIVQDIWNGTENKPHFYRVTIIGESNVKTAEKFLKKGANVILSGLIENNVWEKDGIKHNDLALKAFTIDIVKFPQGNLESKDDSQEITPDEVSDNELTMEDFPF